MADDSYKDYVLDLFRDWEEVSSRKMFGGWGIFNGGIMFGLISDGALYFKVDATNQGDYEEYRSKPFTYIREGKEITLSYWLVPEEVLDSSEMFEDWALKSIDVSRKLKKK